MNEKNTTYYLIWNCLVGKMDEEHSYLFENGEWTPDNDHVITDHLLGFDPFEPIGSPYRMFNLSIMEEIREISREQAAQICGRQLYAFLTEKWKNGFETERAEWGKQYCWPAKLVSTSYHYAGYYYDITPQDIGLTDDPYDQGFMECIQSEIEKDLERYGATHIISGGLID